MDVCIIGSGRVAGVMARMVADRDGLRLAGVAARNVESRRRIAAECRCAECGLDTLPAADIYMLCVRDDAVAELGRGLRFPSGSVAVHTAGCVPVSAIAHPDAGVVYPLQSFSGTERFGRGELPLFTEWTSGKAETAVRHLAECLSDKVCHADGRQRAALHLAAVIANNFSNALHVAAAEILRQSGLEFSALVPMTAAWADKLARGLHPAAIQSGPACRGDVRTMDRHMQMLHGHWPEYEKMYETLSRMIWETSRKM